MTRARSVLRDVIRGLRSWRRSPGSALLAILALGLSGGALVTLVSVFNGLFWRELPVTRPAELVAVITADSTAPFIPEAMFTSLGAAQTVFQSFAAFEHVQSTAVIADASQRLTIDGVSGQFFDTLDVRPLLGRLVSGRDVDAVAPVATISFRCWQDRFGGDRNVIGRTFRLRDTLVSVIGVAPVAFRGLEVGVPTDAWVPAPVISRVLNVPPGLNFFATVGRLRAGRTLQEARGQFESLWPHARDAAAADIGGSLGKTARDTILALQPRIESAGRGFSDAGYRSGYQRTLVLLILCSAITVALAAANLSGLLLARWSAREADLAVRAALGASSGRVVSQVVGESLALSMMAVALSSPFAFWSAKSLVVLFWNQPGVPSPLDLSVDYRVLGIMVGLGGLVALGVSVLPALRVWSATLTVSGGTRGLPGRRVARWGRWLAAAQVALSVPLLVTAWMVAANLHRLEGVNTGFRPDDVVVASLVNQSGLAPAADPAAYFRQLTSSLGARPRISVAALASLEPGAFGADWRRQSASSDDGARVAKAFPVAVSPGYFDALSVPLVKGRDFTWTDAHGSRDVAVISEGLATTLFPGADARGRRIRLAGPPERVLDVIGVVADARIAEPHATSQLFVFTALLQQSTQYLALGSPSVLLKSPLAPRVLEAEARGAMVPLGRHDIFEAHPLRRTLSGALLRERMMRLGAFYFAGITTLLVFVGLYAVLNLDVMRRMPEIGLRLALGASAQDIRLSVMRDALRTAAAGLAIGIPAALASSRLVATSVTLVGSHDLPPFAAAIAVTVVTAALSALIPLRRVSRISPLHALTTR